MEEYDEELKMTERVHLTPTPARHPRFPHAPRPHHHLHNPTMSPHCRPALCILQRYDPNNNRTKIRILMIPFAIFNLILLVLVAMPFVQW